MLWDYTSTCTISPGHAKLFNSTFRYIDDLISLNNIVFERYLDKIYPSELSITKETNSDKEASYLDLLITVKENKFHTKLYDKRDDFNFTIVNYPHPVTSNIPEKPAYGVYASRIISFARVCDHYVDFCERHTSLCESLLRQGYKYGFLCNSHSLTRSAVADQLYVHAKSFCLPSRRTVRSCCLLLCHASRCLCMLP